MPTLAPSSPRNTLETSRILDLVKADVLRTAALAAEAEADSAVPSRPDRTLARIIGHLGSAHRQATAIVTRLPQQRIELTREEIGLPREWSAMPEWLVAGGDALVEALSQADLDAPCYALGTDRHVRWWLRRQLHETAMHRVDVELAALGMPGDLDPAVAVDNIDEFLEFLPHAERFRPELHGDGETIHLHATDTAAGEHPGEWLITLEPHGFRWSHAHVKGAAAVRGTARDLSLWLNHRLPADAPGIERLGEEPLLAYWCAKTAL